MKGKQCAQCRVSPSFVNISVASTERCSQRTAAGVPNTLKQRATIASFATLSSVRVFASANTFWDVGVRNNVNGPDGKGIGSQLDTESNYKDDWQASRTRDRLAVRLYAYWTCPREFYFGNVRDDGDAPHRGRASAPLVSSGSALGCVASPRAPVV